MAKKIVILIEDDWEVMGKGLGNVAHLQYLPSLALLNIAKELNIRLTFMVDVLQQLTFIQNERNDRNIKIQRMIWEENVLMMKDLGHDVQLHLHPQWYNAKYDNGYFYVSKNWNIANYNNEDRKKFIKNTIIYLRNLVRTVDKNYNINSFKAGSWGLQPSFELLNDLQDNGIRIVLGIVDGMKFKSNEFNLDYTKLDEPKYPYYPEFKDITKLSNKQEKLFVIPIHSYILRYEDKVFRGIKKTIKIFNDNSIKNKFCYYDCIPKEIQNLSPMKNSISKFNKYFGNYYQHIDLSVTTVREFKFSIDRSIEFAAEADGQAFPIVVESHTKAYEGNYENIREKLKYIINRYGEMVEIQTLTQFLKEVDDGNVIIKQL